MLDLATGPVMRHTPVGDPLPRTRPPQAPHNVQVDDRGREYCVTFIPAHLLKEEDAVTQEFLGRASVGSQPAHVVVTGDGECAPAFPADQQRVLLREPRHARRIALPRNTGTAQAKRSGG